MTAYREVANSDGRNEFYPNEMRNTSTLCPPFEPSFLDINTPSTSAQAAAFVPTPVAAAPLDPYLICRPSTSAQATAFVPTPVAPAPMDPYLNCMPSTSSQAGFVPLPASATGAAWKCPDWLNHGTGLKQFSGADRLHFKRKMADGVEPRPPKQLITDEKMVAHLNSLHISSNYTTHTQAANASANEQPDSALDDAAMSPTSSYATIASHDLEEKLRSASRITIDTTICEEIRKLAANPILPQAIMDRFENRSCTALVLWQPPQRITELIVPKDVELQRKQEDEEQDNNNCMAIDFNAGDSMELEDI